MKDSTAGVVLLAAHFLRQATIAPRASFLDFLVKTPGLTVVGSKQHCCRDRATVLFRPDNSVVFFREGGGRRRGGGERGVIWRHNPLEINGLSRLVRRGWPRKITKSTKCRTAGRRHTPRRPRFVRFGPSSSGHALKRTGNAGGHVFLCLHMLRIPSGCFRFHADRLNGL